MASKAVSNTGPIMHLAEIDLIKVLNVFKEVYMPPEVKNELKRSNIKQDIIKKIKVISLKTKFKDIAEILVNKFSLDLGEAQAISLALQEKVDYFLTDDLDARTVANLHSVESHGTVGIILRAFREKIINKQTAIKKVNEIYNVSSLFITKDLINQIISSINEFRR